MFGVNSEFHIQNKHKGPLETRSKQCSLHNISYIVSTIANVLNLDIRPPILVYIVISNVIERYIVFHLGNPT
jgi:hypothetical protein